MLEYNGEKLKGTEEAIARYAISLNLELYFSANFIAVDTKAGKWRIILDTDTTFSRLEHQNYRSVRTRVRANSRGQIGEYHEHKLKNNDVYNALEYIARHDKKLIKKYN